MYIKPNSKMLSNNVTAYYYYTNTIVNCVLLLALTTATNLTKFDLKLSLLKFT